MAGWSKQIPSILVALAFGLLAACDARQPVAQGGAAALVRNLAHARVVEIHVAEESAAEPLRRLAALERARSGRDVRVLVGAPGDPAAARIVVGTPRSGVAATLAARAGLAIPAGGAVGFRVGDLDHGGPEDAARATFEDPDRPGLPVTVWLGNDLARLVPQIEDAIPRAKPAFATWRGGDPALAGTLWPTGGVVPRDLQRLGIARAALRRPSDTIVESDGFRVEVAADLEAEVSARVLRDLGAARERASAWAGDPLPGVAVKLLTAVEDLRLGGEDQSLGRWNRARPAADMLVLAGVTDGGAAAVRAGLRAALGPAVVPWIEQGASVAAARSWWGRDLDRWWARLVLAGIVPRAAVLVDPASDARVSVHVLAPARAVLFEHLRSVRGDEFVRAVWCGTRALVVDDELEDSFAAAAHERAQPFRAEVAGRGTQKRESVLAAPPLAGCAFVESDPDPRSGYGSRKALAVLDSLRGRGARSIALDAAFVESRVAEGWRVPRPLAALSGDVALFATASAANSAGLRVALFPDVLASDAGTYSGSWPRDLEADWAAYFERHARAIEHAGLLASLCGADWLGVGSALRAVSGADPEGRRSLPEETLWKREGWRRVIGAARGAFQGGLTYGATDLIEAERVGFWGDLDAIGFELDPRIEPGTAIPRADIEQKLLFELQGLGRIAQRSERPVLLTHVTFAPVLEGDAAASADWDAIQILLLSGAIQSAIDAGKLDLRAAWLGRVGTDPVDRGANARDPVLRAELDPALQLFFAGTSEWIRAGSRSGERSPR
ncbi:MAG: hypothetical protein NTY35_13525 [Planctomycetota bacterium]|nr:hypothetical protein [Planctomycetota bacterium]